MRDEQGRSGVCMTRRPKDLSRLKREPGHQRLQTINIFVNVTIAEGDALGASYENKGQIIGAMGENAQARDIRVDVAVRPGELDIAALSGELALLRAAMKKAAHADSEEHDEEIGLIASAQKAADSGDRSKVLGLLKGAGKWTLEVAKSVAATVVKDVIEGKIPPV